MSLYARCRRCEKDIKVSPYFARPSLDNLWAARAFLKDRPCLNCRRTLTWCGEFLTPCACGAFYGPHNHIPRLWRLWNRVRNWFVQLAIDLGWKP